MVAAVADTAHISLFRQILRTWPFFPSKKMITILASCVSIILLSKCLGIDWFYMAQPNIKIKVNHHDDHLKHVIKHTCAKMGW